MRGKWRAQRADRGAHAARGFVGGAAIPESVGDLEGHSFNAARGFVGGAASSPKMLTRTQKSFQCRTRLCGWCSIRGGCHWIKTVRFNAARGFVGGAAPTVSDTFFFPYGFQCRTRLCGWCSYMNNMTSIADALFQCRTRLCGWCSTGPNRSLTTTRSSFNAARGFVGGAACRGRRLLPCPAGFNAARGFVGGAASSLAALVPLGGKSPFGKSPEI